MAFQNRKVNVKVAAALGKFNTAANSTSKCKFTTSDRQKEKRIKEARAPRLCPLPEQATAEGAIEI